MKTLAEILPNGTYKVNLYKFFSTIYRTNNDIELDEAIKFGDIMELALTTHEDFCKLTEDEQEEWFHEVAYETTEIIMDTKKTGELHEIKIFREVDNVVFSWQINIEKIGWNDVELFEDVADEDTALDIFKLIYLTNK